MLCGTQRGAQRGAQLRPRRCGQASSGACGHTPSLPARLDRAGGIRWDSGSALPPPGTGAETRNARSGSPSPDSAGMGVSPAGCRPDHRAVSARDQRKQDCPEHDKMEDRRQQGERRRSVYQAQHGGTLTGEPHIVTGIPLPSSVRWIGARGGVSDEGAASCGGPRGAPSLFPTESASATRQLEGHCGDEWRRRAPQHRRPADARGPPPL